MMLRSALILSLLLAASAAHAKPESVAQLKARWLYLNEQCVGRPDQTPHSKLCLARDATGFALEKRGVCWAYSDWRVFPVEYDWHPCSQARPKGWKPDPLMR